MLVLAYFGPVFCNAFPGKIEGGGGFGVFWLVSSFDSSRLEFLYISVCRTYVYAGVYQF